MSCNIVNREDDKILSDKICNVCNQRLTLAEYLDYKDICEKCLTTVIKDMG